MVGDLEEKKDPCTSAQEGPWGVNKEKEEGTPSLMPIATREGAFLHGLQVLRTGHVLTGEYEVILARPR